MKHSYHDLTLPQPFMNPDACQAPPDDGVACILPLDLVVSLGGPMRSLALEVLNRASRQEAADVNLIWRCPLSFFSGEDSTGLIRRQEAAKWISMSANSAEVWLDEEGAPSQHEADGLIRLLGLPRARKVKIEKQRWSPTEFITWVEVIAPEFAQAQSRAVLQSFIENYTDEFPEALRFPIEGLRFFSGFLRRRGHDASAVAFARDWAKFQALYSIQDEENERQSLSETQVMLNPTLQLHRHRVNDAAQVTAFVRANGQVVAHELRPPVEPALLDELVESGRMEVSSLMASVNSLFGASSRVGPIESALRDLSQLGLILRHRPSANINSL